MSASDGAQNAAPEDSALAADRGSRPARVSVIAVLGLIVAWFTWDAVGNLVALPVLLEEFGLGETVPWPALVLGVAMPVVYYGVAVAIGTRLPLARLALVLVTSLGAIAVTRLSLVAVATGAISVLG